MKLGLILPEPKLQLAAHCDLIRKTRLTCTDVAEPRRVPEAERNLERIVGGTRGRGRR